MPACFLALQNVADADQCRNDLVGLLTVAEFDSRSSLARE